MVGHTKHDQLKHLLSRISLPSLAKTAVALESAVLAHVADGMRV